MAQLPCGCWSGPWMGVVSPPRCDEHSGHRPYRFGDWDRVTRPPPRPEDDTWTSTSIMITPAPIREKITLPLTYDEITQTIAGEAKANKDDTKRLLCAIELRLLNDDQLQARFEVEERDATEAMRRAEAARVELARRGR